MLTFYIRAVAAAQVAFTVARYIFAGSDRAWLSGVNGWLLIHEPRTGLTLLELILLGDSERGVQFLPAVVSVVLFMFARRIVATIPGLLAYISFEGLYALSWGGYLIYGAVAPKWDGEPHTIGDLVNSTTAVFVVASAIPLWLALKSLQRLRMALAWRDAGCGA